MSTKRNAPNAPTVPDGFVLIGPATPPKHGLAGTLVRERATGKYALITPDGALHSVNHKWAQDHAAELGKPADAIQALCIQRMHELGMNPNMVAEKLAEQVSRSHINDYLTLRSSIGSHKLQHVLEVLKLQIVAK